MKEVTIDQAVAEINRKIGEVKNLSRAGLWEAALGILASAQKRLQASVITGNLRASAYARNESQIAKPEPAKLDPAKNEPIPGDPLPELGVEVGFSANYALFVHENMEARTPKFLEGAITDNEREIVEIVKRRSGGQ